MRLNGFDLNQLICLEALLNERSVSRAAKRVHLSQSAMSWVLAQLRDHFNDPLLVRSGRQFVLTTFAQNLTGPVSELLARAYALTALTPTHVPANIDRDLKVIASDYAIASYLAPAMQAAIDSMPRLRFDLLPLTAASVQALRDGEVDLLCAGQALDVGRPANALLCEDHFVCLACAAKGPSEDTLSLDDYLMRHHVVMRYFEHRMAFEDEEALRREGVSRSQQIAVWSTLSVPHIIMNTDMLATVPERIARLITAHWPIKMLPFPLPLQPLRNYAYWHPSRDDDVVLAQFVGILQRVAAGAAEP